MKYRLTALALAMALLFGCASCQSSSAPSPSEATTATAESTPGLTPEPTLEPTPEPTPKPTPTVSDEDLLSIANSRLSEQYFFLQHFNLGAEFELDRDHMIIDQSGKCWSLVIDPRVSSLPDLQAVWEQHFAKSFPISERGLRHYAEFDGRLYSDNEGIGGDMGYVRMELATVAHRDEQNALLTGTQLREDWDTNGNPYRHNVAIEYQMVCEDGEWKCAGIEVLDEKGPASEPVPDPVVPDPVTPEPVVPSLPEASDSAYLDYLSKADEAMSLRDTEAASEWLSKAEAISGETTEIQNRRKIISLFDESYWLISKGVTIGTAYWAIFHIDGTFHSITGSLIRMDGTYTYDGTYLTVDDTVYIENSDGTFQSLEQYEMMGDLDYRIIRPDPYQNYEEFSK